MTPEKDPQIIEDALLDVGVFLVTPMPNSLEKGFVDRDVMIKFIQEERKQAQRDLIKHKTSKSGISLSGVLVYEAMQEELQRLEDRAVEFQNAKNTAYRQRNEAALGMARMAMALGMPVGVLEDKTRAGFPYLLYIDLPTGQVSWHFMAMDRDLLSPFQKYEREWDGHDDDERSRRLISFSEGGQTCPSS